MGIVEIIKIITATALGILLILARKPFAHASIAFQNKVYGFKFGKKEVNTMAMFYFFLGIVFIIAGIYYLVQRF